MAFRSQQNNTDQNSKWQRWINERMKITKYFWIWVTLQIAHYKQSISSVEQLLTKNWLVKNNWRRHIYLAMPTWQQKPRQRKILIENNCHWKKIIVMGIISVCKSRKVDVELAKLTRFKWPEIRPKSTFERIKSNLTRKSKLDRP